MIPHHIVFIHGIGNNWKNFSKWLEKVARKEFNNTVLRISSQKPPDNSLSCYEALWYEITQPDQDELWNRLFPWMRPRGKFPKWSELRINPLNIIYRLKYWSWLRKVVVSHQGDLIAYLKSPGVDKYTLIHDKIYAAIESCKERTLPTEATFQNPALLTVVTHSLGAVIASDMLYDTLVKKTKWWPLQIRLANMISLGSPLALYALRYGLGEKHFQKPLRMQDKHGLWINVYDPQDVIGYPLKSLNEAYKAAVFLDKEINAGQWWNPWHLLIQNTPFCHNLYLKDRTVGALIGQKAALDWLKANRPDMKAALEREYEEYRKRAVTM